MAVVVAGCGGGQVPSAPGVATQNAIVDAPAGHFRLLHAFANAPDGSNPSGALVQLDGTLYGLTNGGGKDGYGTIYSLSVTGKEKVLYSFDGYDGYSPEGSLLAYNGILYGTVPLGFRSFYGGVYSFTRGGEFKMLFEFNGENGLNPAAGLVAINGTLYGTTYQGGSHGTGTLYAMDTSGNEHVIHNFGQHSGDGTFPACTVLFWKNKLYGTTDGGGTNNDGTVFSVTMAGKETVLHSFGSGKDGGSPGSSNLTALDGLLYGTTYQGGTHGEGIVFSISASGNERILYNFGGKSGDATYPDSGVILYHDALYGTTAGGGKHNQGTIFRITPDGKETVLYSFTGDEGSNPIGRLLPEGTNMYGTLFVGGEHRGTGSQGGAAFRFTP